MYYSPGGHDSTPRSSVTSTVHPVLPKHPKTFHRLLITSRPPIPPSGVHALLYMRSFMNAQMRACRKHDMYIYTHGMDLLQQEARQIDHTTGYTSMMRCGCHGPHHSNCVTPTIATTRPRRTNVLTGELSFNTQSWARFLQKACIHVPCTPGDRPCRRTCIHSPRWESLRCGRGSLDRASPSRKVNRNPTGEEDSGSMLLCCIFTCVSACAPASASASVPLRWASIGCSSVGGQPCGKSLPAHRASRALPTRYCPEHCERETRA
ncbi:uncharacterized protein K489DRAFT_175860 [Dissoconium aciculare CBS 342.82]|uniref:Uncharacterized protein n=1 Tax=Dissoconium aciculare CBS 342.82 TaxID=1314786 RepID=A0A6J3M7Y5_9PEZI|nr:uncharacterized protein K489DRAFT_175860 [Dissoconium aciculare CBS 342.82]KAF1824166.1 hypothetical protein K489DRAFT_175860 [Dissoconium aciculare CBS 342.82]